MGNYYFLNSQKAVDVQFALENRACGNSLLSPHPVQSHLCTVSLGLSSIKVKTTFLKVYSTSAVQVHASTHREYFIFLFFSPCLSLVGIGGHKAGWNQGYGKIFVSCLNGPIGLGVFQPPSVGTGSRISQRNGLKSALSQVIACQLEFKLDPVLGQSVSATGWLLLEILFLEGHGPIGQVLDEDQSPGQVHSSAHPNAYRSWKYTLRSFLSNLKLNYIYHIQILYFP